MVSSGLLSPEIKSFRRSRNSLEFGWGEVLQQHFRNVFSSFFLPGPMQ
ncbi:hypothetical protein GQ600_16645 [Phytophthora cactorum]|nr:hypothetical protein GQ600_16645 [Phytophthora cactorum]